MSKHLLWGLFGLKLLSRIIIKLKMWRCSPFSTDNTSLPNLSLFPLLLLAYFSRQTKRFELGKDRSCLSGVFLREREFLWCRSFAELKCLIIGYSGLKKACGETEDAWNLFSYPLPPWYFFSPLHYRLGEISLSLQLSSAKKFKIVSIHISRELERTMVRERNSVQKNYEELHIFFIIISITLLTNKTQQVCSGSAKRGNTIGKMKRTPFSTKKLATLNSSCSYKKGCDQKGKRTASLHRHWSETWLQEKATGKIGDLETTSLDEKAWVLVSGRSILWWEHKMTISNSRELQIGKTQALLFWVFFGYIHWVCIHDSETLWHQVRSYKAIFQTGSTVLSQQPVRNEKRQKKCNINHMKLLKVISSFNQKLYYLNWQLKRLW